MLESLSLSKAARFARSFTGQVAMSVAVSAAVAGVLAVPELLLGRSPDLTDAGATAEIAQLAVVPTYHEGFDGKFADRHRAALDEAGATRRREAGLVTPASLVMPMSVSWPQAARLEPEPRGQAVQEPRLLSVSAETLPPRRPLALAEPPKLAAQATPLRIAPSAAALAPRPDESGAPAAAPGLLGRVVVRPVARVSEAVSGAAGAVGSAGSWTVSQVAGLLPRW